MLDGSLALLKLILVPSPAHVVNARPQDVDHQAQPTYLNYGPMHQQALGHSNCLTPRRTITII